jgi:hypothetical protein
MPHILWRGKVLVSNIIVGARAKVVNAPIIVADYWKRPAAERQAGFGALDLLST